MVSVDRYLIKDVPTELIFIFIFATLIKFYLKTIQRYLVRENDHFLAIRFLLQICYIGRPILPFFSPVAVAGVEKSTQKIR